MFFEVLNHFFKRRSGPPDKNILKTVELEHAASSLLPKIKISERLHGLAELICVDLRI